MTSFPHAREVIRMYRNLPAPIQRLHQREAGIFEPTLIEECSGAIWSRQPDQPRNGVDNETNVLRLSSEFGSMPRRCHRRIINPFCDCTFWPIPVPTA